MSDVHTATDTPASALGMDGYDSKVKDVAERLKPVQEAKTAADDKIYSGIEATTDRLLPRIEQLSKDAGVEAEKMEPWNADEEANKRRTDPIEAFGSFGSVFGILASAFTHAPMENALNASAAAMTAIKEGDKTAYDRAYQAQEHNFKMAMERQKIQHEVYQDATSLLNTNLQAAQTKLQVNAARFQDHQISFMLEAGYPPNDIMQVINARQQLAEKMEADQPARVLAHAEMSRLFALGYDPKNPTAPASQEALQKYKQEQVDFKQAERAYTPEQQAYAQFIKENPKATPEERSDYIQGLRTRKKDLTPEQEATTRWIEEHPDGTADELKAFVTDLRATSRGTGGAGNTALTKERQIAAQVKTELDEWKQAHPESSASEIGSKRDELFRKHGTASSSPSGNKIDSLKGKIQQIDNITAKSERILTFLQTHKSGAGLAGKLMRGEEIGENITGISTNTDRNQFRRDVRELQDIVPQILTDTQGRPLASAQAKVDDIVAGLNAGDTGPNTIRAYRELLEEMKKRRGDYEVRLRGDSPPASDAAPAPSTTKSNWRTQAIPIE